MGKIVKQWQDETAGKSNIGDQLVFLPDRRWTTCTVTMDGIHKLQTLHSEVWTDKKLGEKTVNDEERGTKYSCPINARTSVRVEGYLQNKINPTGASGKVEVACEYDDASVMPYETATWGDETAGNSLIKNLFLPATHKWEQCAIVVKFKENHFTGCMVTLLKKGELAYLPDGTLPAWKEHTGNGCVTYTFDINAKVPLVVAGYISNKSFGGGASITLYGFYKGE